MKVNWFIPVHHTNYNRMPASVWIRCLQMLPYLAKLGVKSAVNQPDRRADVAVFIRHQTAETGRLMRQQKEQGAKVVFDLVVNYLEPSGPVAGLGEPVSQGQVEMIKKLIYLADGVTCASQFIANKAAEHHPCVRHLPDPIDFDYFKYCKREADFRDGRLVAVWSGIARKTAELETLLPLLAKYQIDLQVITNKRPHFTKRFAQLRSVFDPSFHPISYHRWRYQTFPKQLVTGHFGLSPRQLNVPYNLGHSSFKIAVFLAQGMPVLASSVPSYMTLMGDRQAIKSGRFCDTIEEWDRALSEISNNREQLVSFHRQAQQTAKTISCKNVAQACHQFFRLLCDTHDP